ncbi:MAG: metallophosphoesterase family protein [Oscillospiraceae bacterium]|nr:metallophosphoesterase family protein [Oscillospiraceae bacterium]
MPVQALRFRQGRFKILHMTDIQDSCDVSPQALRLIAAALDREKPDLVVFTGDQIAGYSPKLKGSGGPENIRKTIRQLLAPLEERGIPFTFTFGNHDEGSALPLREQFAVYAASPCCVAGDTPGVSGCGNHHLPIFSEDGGKMVFNLYLLDSHGNSGLGGYAPLEADQVDWYRRTREALKAQNGGRAVPALLFMHIPVPNVYDMLRKVKKSKGAVRGFRSRRGEYYALNEADARKGAVFVETPCVPDTDAGLFAAAQEERELLGMYFGHDHKNAFVGKWQGIDLGYTPGISFSAYGPGLRRGVRVIELNEAAPEQYETHVLTMRELLGEEARLPFMTKLMDQTPTSFDDALPKLLRLALGLLGLGAVIALLVLFL